MDFTPIKIPRVAKKMFPHYVWDVPNNEKVIYLTFDDGPTPKVTEWTLETLKQYNAKATFFCIGKNIETHPDIFHKIIKEGHNFGNHTHNHIKGWQTKTKDYLGDISQAQKTINNQVERYRVMSSEDTELLKLNLFRPPYGKIKPKQGQKLIAMGYKIIMWDILAFDWDKEITPETCSNNVISKASDGSIVVFHDSVKASKNMQFALPKVLEHFHKKGYAFKALKF